METIANANFRGERVVVDGKRFQRCSFENTTLVFAGDTLPAFVDCQFADVTLQFDGAAARTLRFISGLHKGGFSQAVDGVFKSIRV